MLLPSVPLPMITLAMLAKLTVVATVLYKFCVVAAPTTVPGLSVNVPDWLPICNAELAPVNAFTVVGVLNTATVGCCA